MTITFDQLGLPNKIVSALRRRDVTEPFPIQAASIPDALAGHDICGEAPTGSGKTLAFGTALLARVEQASAYRPRALVLAPTRELADQITRELVPLAKAASRRIGAVYGGVGYGPQKSMLRRGVDVVVATPGRLEDLIAQGSIKLGEIDIVVIDEADRMADMGFLPAVRRILDLTSDRRQTLLFSATLDGDVAVLSRDYQNDPKRHQAEAAVDLGAAASHHFWLVNNQDRVGHVATVVTAEGKSIVFTRTRRGADRLTKQLDRLGIASEVLHGGRSQSQRNRAVKAFATGRVVALVATDVAARGIHVDAVAAVIHFDLPGDAKDYVHRSGRTARAGAGGKVVSLVTESQRRQVRTMARQLDLDAELTSPGRDASSRSQTGGSGSVTNGTDRSGTDQSLYVANLPWSVTSDELRDLFKTHGAVYDSVVITDRKSGRSRGFGFVEMPSADAKLALSRLNGSTVGGRDLTVKMARPRAS